MRALLLALLVGGCCPSGSTEPIENQEHAVHVIWYETFRAGAYDPPRIGWRRDRCNEPNGIYGTWPHCTFTDQDGERVSGHCVTGCNLVEIGAPSETTGKISDTVLAHELMHAYQEKRDIDDPDHERDEWKLVILANAKLVSAGF